jgi:gliding motility-associated-like protein
MLGNIGNLNLPYQPALIKQDSNWFMLVSNAGDSSISRLSFGTSLSNTPTGENLGNLGLLAGNQGITILKDCQSYNGLVANNAEGSNPLLRLNLNNGITGTITAQPLGNIGSLNQPETFSDFLRVGDTIYTLLTNSGSNSVSILYFPSCTNSSIPSSTFRNPPAVTYASRGIYNIQLVTNEGLPDQEVVCKPIHVMGSVGTGTTDTLLCFGQRYFAGGTWQTRAGTYYDTIQTSHGCDSVHISNLSYKAEINMNLGTDTVLCPGQTVTLHANFPGGTYQWQDGSTDSVFIVTKPGTYWLHVIKDKCLAGDTLFVNDCPARIWVPKAFTPNGDGLNDVFLTKGISIGKFHMEIYDRSGQRLFVSDDKDTGWDGTCGNKFCPPGVYSYIIMFVATDTGEIRKVSGTVTMVR